MAGLRFVVQLLGSGERSRGRLVAEFCVPCSSGVRVISIVELPRGASPRRRRGCRLSAANLAYATTAEAALSLAREAFLQYTSQ